MRVHWQSRIASERCTASLKTTGELYDPKAMLLAIKHPSLVHYIDLLRETNFLI